MWQGPVRVRVGDNGFKVIVYTPFEFDTTETVSIYIKDPDGVILNPHPEIDFEDDFSFSFNFPDILIKSGEYQVWFIISNEDKKITTPTYTISVSEV